MKQKLGKKKKKREVKIDLNEQKDIIKKIIIIILIRFTARMCIYIYIFVCLDGKFFSYAPVRNPWLIIVAVDRSWRTMMPYPPSIK